MKAQITEKELNNETVKMNFEEQELLKDFSRSAPCVPQEDLTAIEEYAKDSPYTRGLLRGKICNA